MKLVIITAISEFEKNIKSILKNATINTYSFKEVIGYKDVSDQAVENNWFATEMNETESILFYAFVADEKVDTLLNLIKEFNTKQETTSVIHLAVVAIEKNNQL